MTFLSQRPPWLDCLNDFSLHKKMYSNNKMSFQYKFRKDRKTPLNWFCAFDLLFVWNSGYDVSLSNSRAMLAKMFTLELEGVGKAWAEHGQTAHSATDLDGRFAGDVGDQEVHGDVLTVYVLVHHIPDGLGHHVGVQIGVVLQIRRGKYMIWLMHKQKDTFSWNTVLSVLEGKKYRTLWKKAAPVRTMESSQE